MIFLRSLRFGIVLRPTEENMVGWMDAWTHGYWVGVDIEGIREILNVVNIDPFREREIAHKFIFRSSVECGMSSVMFRHMEFNLNVHFLGGYNC